MREDREWNENYNRFKLEKEKRKRIEMGRSSPPASPSSTNTRIGSPNSFRHSPRAKLDENAERTFVNKGPSRFLREHSSKNQETSQVRPQIQQSQQSASPIVIVDDKEDSKPAVMKEEGKGFSFVDVLPYIFILIGIAILVLILTRGIKI